MQSLNRFFPKWRTMAIHESSPGWDKLSQRLVAECQNYVASQWRQDVAAGTLIEYPRLPCKRYYVENLEHQTFPDNSFDLVVTQDVFEHMFHPDRAIAEIARTLKPGGGYIMSVPVVRRAQESRRRTRLRDDGTVENIFPAEYHGNPVGGGDGSIVTIDWGFDIGAYLAAASGMHFVMLEIDDLTQGIRDECNMTIVGFKKPIPNLS
jgi:SAM-dependent methyltransferase